MGQRWPVRGVTTIFGVVPLGVGVVVLLGWYLDLPALVRLSSTLPAMQSATAVAFLFSGLAILAVDRGHVGAAAILGGFVAAIGLLSVAGRLLGVPLDLASLASVPDVAGGAVPARPMAPKSGLSFLLTGLATVFLTRAPSRTATGPLLALVGALAVLLLAGEDLLKYGAESTGLSGRTLKQMALHTVIAFLALAVAVANVAQGRLRARSAPGIRRAVLAAAAVLVVSGMAAHGIRTGQVEGIRRMARIAGQETATRLAAGIEARREAVAALAAQAGDAAADSAEWIAFATALTDHVSGIDRIVWIDDGGIVRWSAPPGPEVPAEPSIGVPAPRADGPGGTVVASLDLRELLGAAVPGSAAFSLELIAGDVHLTHDAGHEGTDPVFIERLDVSLPGRAGGTLLVRPSRELLEDTRRPLPLAALAIGTLFAAMLSVIVQLGATAQDRATHLQAALGRLEGAVRERRRAESALARSEARLRESRKMAAVARLAGGVAHHFNNLLSVVRGYADLLREPQDPNVARSYLEEISRAAVRGGELTRNLLTISARHVLHPRTLELRAIVYGQSRALGRVLGEGIQLRIRAETADTRVHIDPGPFTNALMTLASNARDAMPEGGSLALTLRERALTPADAANHGVRAGAYVELEVADTGAGMDEMRRETLFEPFSGGQRPDRDGGFGLAMLYGFVRQSGGAVEVESQPGRGSAFRLLLPRADGRAAVRPTSGPGRPVGDAPRVLLVEDEDSVRGLAVRIFDRAGFDTMAAADGEDALALVRGREHDVDVVVTDVVMPGVDGIELARRLWLIRPGLPVLFISGYTADEIPGDSAAPTAFVQKPFEAHALVACVRRLLLAHGPVAVSD